MPASKKSDDFVMTIDDDDDNVPVDEDEEDEAPSKKAPAKKSADFDPGFSFSFGESQAPQQPWDFAEAKKALHPQGNTTTADHKISKRIEARALKQESKDKPVKKEIPELDSGDDEEDDDASDAEGEAGGEDGASEDGESGGEGEEEDDDAASGEEDDDADSDAQAGSESEGEEDEDAEPTPDRMKDVKQVKLKPAAQNKFFSQAPDVDVSTTFEDLKLARPLLKAVTALGWSNPTPVQARSIPLLMQNRDICASAVTGSGKTGAFVLPLLQRLLLVDRRVKATRALILIPTRELAVQCHSTIEKLAQHTDITCCLIIGGLSNAVQEAALRKRPDIVVATPGRIIDHVRNAQSVGLDDVEVLILDEADRLLELGFMEETKQIVKACPRGRQTVLFSATMTEQVDQLIQLSLNHPIRVAVDMAYDVAETLSQEFIKIKAATEREREAVLLALCTRTVHRKAIVFCMHKKTAHRLKLIFGLASLNAAELHGNMSQSQRLEALEKFRDAQADFLIATDLAARGLDIIGIETVINYTMPRTMTNYVHRVGRTARAGEVGKAISLASEADRNLLKVVVKKAKSKIKQRVLPADAIELWRGKIDDMAEDIESIIAEESEEREMRKAEMEAAKAENILTHHDEIYGRPAKTWFQSEKQKQSLKAQSKAAAEGDAEGSEAGASGVAKRKRDEAAEEKPAKRKKGDKQDKKDKLRGLSRKQRRARMFNGEDLASQQKGQKAVARVAKRQALDVKQGKAVKVPNPPKKQKKDKTAGKSLFEDEIRSGSFGKTRSLPKKMQKREDRLAKEAGTKPKNKPKTKGFKSKKKFKRR
eukprot:TRINITY_DN2833_c0_g1_i1.p1 TRINITY_DN2833_c0_g1~~TRINITY_DN2833_c0_g1_i1.p1  ORF type:complete len:822 (+),score=381.04 TRINITY_DN2833_c0_g1_i1:166-2631(+)